LGLLGSTSGDEPKDLEDTFCNGAAVLPLSSMLCSWDFIFFLEALPSSSGDELEELEDKFSMAWTLLNRCP